MILTSGKPESPQVWHLSKVEPEERQRLYGRGSAEVAEVLTAGSMTTVTFQFEIGQSELPVDGRLRIAWRWPLDWSDLQSDDPHAAGYMRVFVRTASPAPNEEPAFEPIYFQTSDLDPWMHCVELGLRRGGLTTGDCVQLVCGDRSAGGLGWRAPTCCVKQAKFLMLFNADGSDRWIQLANPPTYSIQPGPPTRLVAVAPSQAEREEPFEMIVRAEDRWGNATSPGEIRPEPELVSLQGLPVDAKLGVRQVRASADPPAQRLSLSIDRIGSYCIRVSVPERELSTQSNPCRIGDRRPQLSLYWGDLHSGQTEIGCGAGSLADHYRYARDAAGLQFATHQANDHYVTLPLWQQTRKLAKAFHEPGSFVVFLGCEWSPPTADGGDRNVIYREDEARLRRSGRFYTESEPDPEPDIPTAPEFHEAFKDEQIMVNMHVGGRPTNLNYHAPALEPLAEIHSTHGTSEWFVQDALERGYKVGITAGTDGVTGRPGADHPGWRLNRNVRSGLTAVYASDLQKEALWQAFRARRCYATTGERIRLWVEVDGHPMGSEYATGDHPLIKVEIEGTAAIETVDLLRGTDVLCRWQIAARHADLLRILWSGTRARGTARAQRLVWDGMLRAEEGTLSEARPIGFQSADDLLCSEDARTLRWRSATGGNAAGFVFRWDEARQACCHFAAPPTTFRFSQNLVNLAPMTVDAGYVEGRVQVGPAPREDGTRQVGLSFRDEVPLNGVVPYWVRVVQVDQARAWSSPVYVRYGP